MKTHQGRLAAGLRTLGALPVAVVAGVIATVASYGLVVVATRLPGTVVASSDKASDRLAFYREAEPEMPTPRLAHLLPDGPPDIRAIPPVSGAPSASAVPPASVRLAAAKSVRTVPVPPSRPSATAASAESLAVVPAASEATSDGRRVTVFGLEVPGARHLPSPTGAFRKVAALGGDVADGSVEAAKAVGSGVAGLGRTVADAIGLR